MLLPNVPVEKLVLGASETDQVSQELISDFIIYSARRYHYRFCKSHPRNKAQFTIRLCRVCLQSISFDPGKRSRSNLYPKRNRRNVECPNKPQSVVRTRGEWTGEERAAGNADDVLEHKPVTSHINRDYRKRAAPADRHRSFEVRIFLDDFIISDA